MGERFSAALLAAIKAQHARAVAAMADHRSWPTWDILAAQLKSDAAARELILVAEIERLHKLLQRVEWVEGDSSVVGRFYECQWCRAWVSASDRYSQICPREPRHADDCPAFGVDA